MPAGKLAYIKPKLDGGKMQKKRGMQRYSLNLFIKILYVCLSLFAHMQPLHS